MLFHRLSPENSAVSYSNFMIDFWVDRFLMWINVFPPLMTALLLGLLHAFKENIKCNIFVDSKYKDESDFLNKFCGLQLANNVLYGRSENFLEKFRGSLQHEYYPFLLLITAFIFWLPHAVWRKSVELTSRQDLTLIRNELQNFREAAMRELNRRGDDSEINLVDFTASVSDLPHLHACQINWSLTHYLSSWQTTDFYWRRYLCKHMVVFILQVTTFVTIFTTLCMNSGAPFVSTFLCILPNTLAFSASEVQCILRSTFYVNISVVVLYLCNIAGILAQLAYFYSNYAQSKYSFREQLYFEKCFFGCYIRLMAYSQFRKEELERLRGLSISLMPGFLRCDFHYLSLLCTENQKFLTDVFHVHYWTERFMRAIQVRKGFCANRLRRSSCGVSRSEDISLKLNFQRMKLKVEINDLFL